MKVFMKILYMYFQVERIEERCLELFDRDYKYSIIHNTNGEVCGHYPRKIVFLEYESSDNNKESFESTVQISKLQDLVNRSKMARCRGRFVCPVILYNGKHVCRSSTLAGWGELYGRTGYNYIFSGGSDDTFGDAEEVPEDDCAVRNNDSQLFDKVRGSDIKLLKYLSVCYICDLMVENKKVKFGLNVTSSEKVDKAHRYADFTLLSVPYPGCEFFREYKDRDYTAEGLVFNWNQDYMDAPLTIPDFFTRNLNINWSEYQSWDLVQQTQNYLKLLLHIINSDDENGLLVHCISGWDRTPLFVSLLRLSLWADRAIHASLEPSEILYLTIAYDWFLFGLVSFLFHLHIYAVTKIKETVLRDLLFADDCALNAGSEQEMQASTDKFTAACDNFGLLINTKKTEVMHQPAPKAQYQEPTITVKGQKLQAVDLFTYLGSTFSRAVTIDIEVNCRIAKTSSTFGGLRTNVWDRRGISLATKLKVYRAVVLTTLMYASETWTVYRRHARQLNHFHTTCLCRLLRIRWQDKVPDTEVLSRAGMPSVHTLLMKAQTSKDARPPHTQTALLW
uniref:Myotubularin-related protein 14-like n=1 Tax=Sinocyclocheilus anshuiensis TaxID=1608454 RepID=A0A671KHN5_9TELE